MKKRMAAVISAVAALAIVLTVIVTAFIYHGIYEESIRASLVEEIDILASAYTPNGRNGEPWRQKGSEGSSRYRAGQ